MTDPWGQQRSGGQTARRTGIRAVLSPVFPCSSVCKESACKKQKKRICVQYRRPGFDPWVWRIPLRRKRQPTPVSLPGKSHGHRSLVGCSPRGHKESGTTEQLTFTWVSWHKPNPSFTDSSRSNHSGKDQGREKAILDLFPDRSSSSPVGQPSLQPGR